MIKADIIDQVHGGLEVGVRLARETHNEIGTDRNIRSDLAQLADGGLVLQRRVVAFHLRQDVIGPRLHRQVEMINKFGNLGVDFDERVRKLHRMTGGVANAVNALDVTDQQQQVGEIEHFAVGAGGPVGIDVLAQQIHLAHAHVRQMPDFVQHRLDRPAHFLAARVGHDTEAAVLGAALHDGDVGGGAVHAGLGHPVEFLDFREADIHGQIAVAGCVADQLRQPVQGLRAEDDIHPGRTLADHLAFLTGHTTAHADNQLGFVFLEPFPAAQLVKYLFLRLFPDRAGVEQHHIGFIDVIRGFQFMAVLQDVGHPGRIVFVHLAAVGLYEQFAGHGACSFCRKETWIVPAGQAGCEGASRLLKNLAYSARPEAPCGASRPDRTRRDHFSTGHTPPSKCRLDGEPA